MTLYNDRSQGSMAKLEGDSADSDTQLTKLDVVLTFQLEVSNFAAWTMHFQITIGSFN
jgi:hypothetical protein